MKVTSGPPHQLRWLRGPYALKSRSTVTLRPRSSARASARCSSYIFDTAYDHRLEVGGPSTSVPSSANGGWAFP